MKARQLIAESVVVVGATLLWIVLTAIVGLPSRVRPKNAEAMVVQEPAIDAPAEVWAHRP